MDGRPQTVPTYIDPVAYIEHGNFVRAMNIHSAAAHSQRARLWPSPQSASMIDLSRPATVASGQRRPFTPALPLHSTPPPFVHGRRLYKGRLLGEMPHQVSSLLERSEVRPLKEAQWLRENIDVWRGASNARAAGRKWSVVATSGASAKRQ